MHSQNSWSRVNIALDVATILFRQTKLRKQKIQTDEVQNALILYLEWLTGTRLSQPNIKIKNESIYFINELD